MKGETQFKERFAPHLKCIPFSYWIKTQMMALLGIPDYLGCVQGRFVAIELKKDKKEKLTRIQRYVMDKIQEAGGLTFVAYPENMDSVIREIEQAF
jgi:hypothetical protein